MEYVKAKTIVTRTKNNWWFGTDYGMNIYRGCAFGCIYCDSRSDCYRVEDFGRVRVKEDALRIIRDDLRRKRGKGVIHTGAMSDPYTRAEASLNVMRHALELISAYRFGVAVATKSTLVVRDIDVLQEVARRAPVTVSVTITTVDDELAKRIEPYSPSSSERFSALKELSDAGIFCGVLMMPILPFINDTEENVLEIVRSAHAAGAKYVYATMGMMLRSGQREFFYNNLERNFPDLKEKYVITYGEKYQANSPAARKLYQIFAAECERLGLLYKMEDITKEYQKDGFWSEQLSLF
ncbi:MAG: radical SAM protein [Turicibacter sp.]|nr:radical SAM protein [Turicibacter sp.]